MIWQLTNDGSDEMKAVDKIRLALKQLKGDGYANACQIWKGYDVATGQNGWHYVPFGKTAIYLGTNVKQIMQDLQLRDAQLN